MIIANNISAISFIIRFVVDFARKIVEKFWKFCLIQIIAINSLFYDKVPSSCFCVIHNDRTIVVIYLKMVSSFISLLATIDS